MKQLVITRHGPPDVLQVREAPDPTPGPDEVRIRVRAAGLNFADLLARQGLYPDAPPLPCVVGYEVAGEVDELGDGVDSLRRGDRVIGVTRFRGQASMAVTRAERVFPLPSDWSFEAGAALPVNYLTAHHMLARVAAVGRGETVLVHSGGGGVGLAVAELGKILGIRVIALASAWKHPVLREYGVEPLDGRDPRWWEAVRRVAPDGVDVVIDGVGGDSWRRGYALLAPAGRLICFGVSGLSSGLSRNLLATLWRVLRYPRFAPIPLMNHNRAVAGVNLGHFWNAERVLWPQFADLLRYAHEGRIRPRVDRAFSLAEGPAAHRHLHQRGNLGKVVLLPE